MKRTGYRPTGRPGVGVCQVKLLRLLQGARYVGPVVRLAQLVGFSENSVWVALAGLAGRGMIYAVRVGDDLDIRISRLGRIAARG